MFLLFSVGMITPIKLISLIFIGGRNCEVLSNPTTIAWFLTYRFKIAWCLAMTGVLVFRLSR